MKKVETIIFRREDLNDKRLDFESINYYHFNVDRDFVLKSEIILFIDDNYDTKIIKNRYGNDSWKQDNDLICYNLLKKIYNLSKGPWDDIVISEDLYYEMENVIINFDMKRTVFKVEFPIVKNVGAKLIGDEISGKNSEEAMEEMKKIFDEFEKLTGFKAIIVGDSLPTKVLTPKENTK
jgi:hypothetical protein